LTEEDWAESWKEQYHLLRLGQRMVIVPAWQAYEAASGEVAIRLEPGMAFGTGLHPTTRLCLEALEARLTPGASVLDVGTGSGVLAIAAAMLGAGSVLALDVDPVAVSVARENFQRNDVGHKVKVQYGSLPGSAQGGQWPFPMDEGQKLALLDTGRFDLVLVNILARVIAEMAPALAARLVPGGNLIAAGLIDSQEAEVVRALSSAGLEIVGRAQEEDWVGLVAQRA
jgi:ribosomal protein L11 methyltransferase